MILTQSTVTDNSGNVVLRTTGSVVACTTLTNTTEVALSTSTNGTHWSTSVTKQYGAYTKLIVELRLAMAQCYNGNCGHWISVDGTRHYDNAKGYFDYRYDVWQNSDNHVHGIGEWTGLAAGTKAIVVGWTPADGSSNLPSYYENPGNGRTDSRRRAQQTKIVVWEVVA